MLFRSAVRVTRNVSDTCTSGVPWHPCVTTSSFFLPASTRRSSFSSASSPLCVTWEKTAAPSTLWQRVTYSREFLVNQKRSPSQCMRHSHMFPCSASFPSSQSNILLSSQHTLLRSPSFSSKPSSEEQPKVGIIARYKQMMKDYWYVLIPVHVATSVVWFGGFYIMLKAGVDIVGFLEMIGTSQKVLDYMRNSEAGYYALSYACYKIATPFRYTVTVGGTTMAVAKLQNTGYLKPSSQLREGLKKNYDEGKENLKDKYEEGKENLMEKYDDTKEDFIDMYQDQRRKRLKNIEEIMKKRKG